MCKQFHSTRECSAERQFLFRGIALRSQLFCIRVVEKCASKNAHTCVAGVMCKNVLFHQIVISRKLSLRCRTNSSCYRALHVFLCSYNFFFFRLVCLWRASSGYTLHVWEKLFTNNARTYVCTYNRVSRPINRSIAVRAAPLCHFKFEQQSFTVESSNRNFAPTAEACTLGTRKLPTSGGAITNACGAFTNIGGWECKNMLAMD